MTTTFDHLSLRELESRKVFHENELRRITVEIEERKKSSKPDGTLWEPIDILRRKAKIEFVLPIEVDSREKEEEKKLAKGGNVEIKQMIQDVKNRMKGEIASSVDPAVVRFLEAGSSNNTVVKPKKNIDGNDNTGTEAAGMTEEAAAPTPIKKKVIRKKKEMKTYEDLNPVIRDLWD